MFGTVHYEFDEHSQSEDWNIEYSEEPIEMPHFNIEEIRNEGLWISIQDGSIRVKDIPKAEYDFLVDTEVILQDLWPDFGVNIYLTVEELKEDCESFFQQEFGMDDSDSRDSFEE
jgi:hypothetical protein